MPNLPRQFLKTGEGSIASYSFTNLIEGIGGVEFYAGNALDDEASNVNLLSSQAFYSDSIEIALVATAEESTLISTQTYSLGEAVITNILKGRAIVSFGWGMRANNNNQGQSQGYIVARIVADGVTIGEAKTGTKNSTGTAYTLSAGGQSTLTMDLTETILKVGDVLSLVLLVYGHKISGAVGGLVMNGTDPQNRDGTYLTPSSADLTTRITCMIPFEVRL